MKTQFDAAVKPLIYSLSVQCQIIRYLAEDGEKGGAFLSDSEAYTVT